MANEDFQSRVERISGSLAFSRFTSSTTSTSSAPPLRQTQSGSKREWKREQLASYDKEEMPCASSFDEILRQQRISSTDQKEGEEGGDEDFGDEDDDWSIRASMGLDRTLDDEELLSQKKISGGVKKNGGQGDVVDEEDEYDKVALGKEDGGKGVSMEDAISRPCGVRIRDPRANHAAAKMRLKEDELEANNNLPRLSKVYLNVRQEMELRRRKQKKKKLLDHDSGD
ncbi:hypothetical protein Bca4012_044939 [Brassica carinata]